MVQITINISKPDTPNPSKFQTNLSKIPKMCVWNPKFLNFLIAMCFRSSDDGSELRYGRLSSSCWDICLLSFSGNTIPPLGLGCGQFVRSVLIVSCAGLLLRLSFCSLWNGMGRGYGVGGVATIFVGTLLLRRFLSVVPVLVWRLCKIFEVWHFSAKLSSTRYQSTLLALFSIMYSIFTDLLAYIYVNFDSRIYTQLLHHKNNPVFIVVCLYCTPLYCLTAFSVLNPLPMDSSKNTFKQTLLVSGDLESPNKVNTSGSAKIKINQIPMDGNNPNGTTKGKNVMSVQYSATEKGESSKFSNKNNISDFFSKLSKVKENFKPVQEASLLGFLIGKHLDFNKKKTNKLRFDWKGINGSIDFLDRQMGWFEIRFSNPNDKKKIWEGRPYHIFSQLLLLKEWKPSFDPVTESIFKVDMWVHIPFLPSEYHNFESIKTILDFNIVGSLLKLDPNANKRNWAKFARFCINLDCSKTINREIVIPDEHGNLKKYILWFEDIPQGCGNCGGLDHVFSNCPLRRIIPPKFKITFKKSPHFQVDKGLIADDSETWQTVGKNGIGKAVAPSSNTNNRAGLLSNDFGGIVVHYKTDESSSDSLATPKSVSAEVCPIVAEVPTEMTNNPEAEKSKMPVDENLNEDVYSPIRDINAASYSPEPICTLFPPEENQKNSEGTLEELEKHMEIEALNGEFYYEVDDVDQGPFSDAFIDEEAPYIDGELGELFLVAPLPEFTLEESSFLSFNSEHSMMKKLAGMEVKQPYPSSSESSKRKSTGGDVDTASSSCLGNKKPKTKP